MPAGAFEIREITGDERSVTLRGRALPYPGGAFEGSQRSTLQWYSGNTVATQQILGPEEMPSVFEGMWKDKFLLDVQSGETEADIQGFDTPGFSAGTAEELVAAMDDMRREGQVVRVEWGPYVRTGIVKRFRSEPERVEDIRWEVEFEFSSRNDETAPRAAAAPETIFDLLGAINDVSDIPLPEGLSPDYLALVLNGIADLEESISGFLDDVASVTQLAEAPGLILGRINAAVSNILTQCADIISRLSETAAQFSRANDRPGTILAVEQWKGLVKGAIFQLRRVVQDTESRIEDENQPQASTIITVQAETSLLIISSQQYGTPDEWQFLADVNNLDTSIAPAGFQLFIPPKPVR